MTLAWLQRLGTVSLGWLRGFGRFWYRFIIGDDWTIAAAVAIGLAATAVLNARQVPAWWTMPVVAVAAIAVSLRRASRRSQDS
jgi:hypothetical protein